jgi:hypothetical protein
MKNQPSYSHGLLFSIAPENLASLHLNDEDGKGDFDWEAYKGDSLGRIVLNFLKTSATAQAVSFHFN